MPKKVLKEFKVEYLQILDSEKNIAKGKIKKLKV